MPDEGRRRVAKVVGATGEALGMVAFIEGRAGARVGRAAELVSATAATEETAARGEVGGGSEGRGWRRRRR